MSKHTPGPWAYAPDISRVYSVPTNELVASVAIAGNPACETAWPADARLIAAAPELLALTKAFVTQMEDALDGLTHPQTGPFVKGFTNVEIKADGGLTLDDARAAIAKAEART
ncbi:MAG TPA: hypothetical protein VK196_17025 [Magnetospirillum sp.]|nr:hypothetical protein [Magnetospirillum sp.]